MGKVLRVTTTIEDDEMKQRNELQKEGKSDTKKEGTHDKCL